MYILAVDTTAKTASVCVAEKKEDGTLTPLVRRTTSCGYTHSETLLPMINGCLSDAGITTESLSALAVSAGPGSFTGVRIGVACIKGLSFGMTTAKIAHDCIPVSSLEALAENVQAYSGYILCPVMDARRSQFYNALFKSKRGGGVSRLCDDRLPTAAELYAELSREYSGKKILLVGDGALLCKKLFDGLSKDTPCGFKYSVCDSAYMYQDAYSVAKTAMRHKECAVSGAALSPIYLRASQAERERLEKEAAKQ